MAKNKNGFHKNIFIALGVIVLFILLGLYINEWKKVKELEKYLTSYLLQTNTVNLEMTELNEIKSTLLETSSYYFVYIGYEKSKSVYEFEKDLKPIIDKNQLQNSFYYLNVTNMKETNKNYKTDIAKELSVDESILSDIPVILYFKDGTYQNKVTTINGFEELIEAEKINEL